jgi:hypothetical protein
MDWLNQQWLQGSPPTYQQFAAMWIAEYAFRKTHGSSPKEEWAYIRFAQSQEVRDLTRLELLQAWDQTRNEHWIAVQHVVQSYLQGEEL